MRVWLLILGLPLTCCSDERAPPKSLCDLPIGPKLDWAGTSVTWKGIVQNARPHGIYFDAYECNRAIQIFQDTAGDRLETVTSEYFRTPGVLHVELTATLVRGERSFGLLEADSNSPNEVIGLHVKEVRSLRFERMSEEEFDRFLDQR